MQVYCLFHFLYLPAGKAPSRWNEPQYLVMNGNLAGEIRPGHPQEDAYRSDACEDDCSDDGSGLGLHMWVTRSLLSD